MGKKDQEKKDRNEIMKAMSFLSQIGITMAACVITGVLLGRFLDRLLGTTPWLLLIFSLLGAASALKAIFDLSQK